jgi:hypothetical protein
MNFHGAARVTGSGLHIIVSTDMQHDPSLYVVCSTKHHILHWMKACLIKRLATQCNTAGGKGSTPARSSSAKAGLLDSKPE